MTAHMRHRTNIPACQTSSSKLYFSIVVVETFFTLLILILGLITPLTIVSQQFGIPFQTYRTLCLLFIVFCFILTILFQRDDFKKIYIRDNDVFKWLLLLSIITFIIPLIINHPTADDWDYIPNAVYFLQHPTEAMDYKIHFLYGFQGMPIVSHSQATSLAFEYFRAVIASLISVDFSTIYFRSGVLTGFSIPLAYYLLTTRFVSESRSALTGTVIAVSLTLLSVEGPRSFGIQSFWNAYLGKLFFLSVGIPVFAAISISFFKRPSFKAWLLLFVCVMAMAGMTSSAIILYAILAIVLFLAFVATLVVHSKIRIKKIFSLGKLYFLSLSFGVLYAAFLYIQIKRGITTGNPYNLSGASTFVDQLSYTFDLHLPITPILLVVSVLLIVIFIQGWQRSFILFWALFLFLSFLNPFLTPYVIDTMLPRNIYWRLFFITPFPIVGAVAGYALSPNLAKKLLPVLFSFSLLVYILTTWEAGFLSFPAKSLPFENSNLAIQIIENAPKGLMLAPSEVAGPVTIVSSEYPQLVTRWEDMLYWLGAQNQETDVILRINVGDILRGNNKDYSSIFQLLKKYPQVRSIVIKQEVANSVFEYETVSYFLEKHKYKHSIILGEYVLFWK